MSCLVLILLGFALGWLSHWTLVHLALERRMRREREGFAAASDALQPSGHPNDAEGPLPPPEARGEGLR